MPIFNIKGASCTQAFDKQLPVFFLNLSQLHKHHAVLIFRGLTRWLFKNVGRPFSFKTGSKCWLFDSTSYPICDRKGNKADFHLLPAGIQTCVSHERERSETEGMPETENCGFFCWQHARYQFMYDSIALPLAISFANLTLPHTTAK